MSMSAATIRLTSSGGLSASGRGRSLLTQFLEERRHGLSRVEPSAVVRDGHLVGCRRRSAIKQPGKVSFVVAALQSGHETSVPPPRDAAPTRGR